MQYKSVKLITILSLLISSQIQSLEALSKAEERLIAFIKKHESEAKLCVVAACAIAIVIFFLHNLKDHQRKIHKLELNYHDSNNDHWTSYHDRQELRKNIDELRRNNDRLTQEIQTIRQNINALTENDLILERNQHKILDRISEQRAGSNSRYPEAICTPHDAKKRTPPYPR